LSYLK